MPDSVPLKRRSPRRRNAPALSFPPDASTPPAVYRLFDAIEGLQFWVKDRDGRYRWINRGFLLNYSLERPEQVIGRTDFDLSPPYLADQYRLDDDRVLRGETIAGRVELVGRYDHTAAWSITDKVPMFDAKKRIVGTTGITRAVGTGAAAELDPDFRASGLDRAVALIREDCAKDWSNRALAREANLSARAFERRFRSVFGTTPHQYLRRTRVRLACHALVYTSRTLADVAASHGFADQSHFTREFRRETAMTPGQYRARFSAAGV